MFIDLMRNGHKKNCFPKKLITSNSFFKFKIITPNSFFFKIAFVGISYATISGNSNLEDGTLNIMSMIAQKAKFGGFDIFFFRFTVHEIHNLWLTGVSKSKVSNNLALSFLAEQTNISS
jgi:hypothetical protein